jgi:hypothetical protein
MEPVGLSDFLDQMLSAERPLRSGRDREVVRRRRFFSIAQPKIELSCVDRRRRIFDFSQMVVGTRLLD